MTANELWAKLYMKAGEGRMFEVSHDNKPLGIMMDAGWNDRGEPVDGWSAYPNEHAMNPDNPPADGSEFWLYIELKNFGSLDDGLSALEMAIKERRRRRKAKKA